MEKANMATGRSPISRRSFLRGSLAAGALGGAGSLVAGCAAQSAGDLADTAPAVVPEEQVFPGVCRGGCGGGCQMNVHVRDGKIVKTSRRELSNSETTRVCNKGLTHALRVYDENRIKYPMRRTGERGADEWERITWDEAIATIVDAWKNTVETDGPAANAFMKGSGNITPDAHMGLRLQSAMGATLIDPAQDRAMYVAGPAALGYSNRFCGSGLEDVANSKHLLIWGFNATEANTCWAHYILRAQQQGTKMVVIDPSYTIMASKADLFVPIHPGTDGALAFGMMVALLEEELVDEGFLREQTVAPLLVRDDNGAYLRLSDIGRAEAGSAEDGILVAAADGTYGLPSDISEPVLNGSFTVEGISVTTAYDLLLERIHQWTVDSASAVCDVPADTIRELARMMADGPSAIAPGLGLDHYTNGVATYQAMFAMTMMAGQFGKPGTGAKGTFAIESSQGWMPYGLNVVPDAPESCTFYSPGLLNCMESGKYGDADINVKTLYIWNHNLFATQVGGVKWRSLIEKLDLLVVADVVMTSTARYADIVLPACHYFECESGSGEGTRYVFYNAKAAEPLYESKSDFDIFRMLFDGMGLGEYAFDSIDDVYNAVFDNDVARSLDLTWDRVKEETAVNTLPDGNYVYGADGVWNTPTGRLQFYQESIPLDTDYGQVIDFMKERLPYWEPPMEGWRENALAEKYPLLFTSERSKFKVHSQYTKIPWFLELESEPYVMANPADCTDRGIEDGDYVRIYNDRGTCTLRVRFNDGTRPGMIVIDHGWDQDQFVEGFYCDLIGYNVTPVVANSYYFDALIEMEKATV